MTQPPHDGRPAANIYGVYPDGSVAPSPSSPESGGSTAGETAAVRRWRIITAIACGAAAIVIGGFFFLGQHRPVEAATITETATLTETSTDVSTMHETATHTETVTQTRVERETETVTKTTTVMRTTTVEITPPPTENEPPATE